MRHETREQEKVELWRQPGEVAAAFPPPQSLTESTEVLDLGTSWLWA